MKRKCKKNNDIVNKILKGMVENKEKVEKDLFAQRLKENIMRNRGKEASMSLEVMTDYLNSISASKAQIRLEDVQKEYEANCIHDYERGKVNNQVIDRMLYKGIYRLAKLIDPDSYPAQNEKTPEKKVQKDQKDLEEEKEPDLDEMADLGIRKNNSEQPSLGKGLRLSPTPLDDIDEDSEGNKNSENEEILHVKEAQQLPAIEELVLEEKQGSSKLKRKDSETKQAEEDTDEEIIDTNAGKDDSQREEIGM